MYACAFTPMIHATWRLSRQIELKSTHVPHKHIAYNCWKNGLNSAINSEKYKHSYRVENSNLNKQILYIKRNRATFPHFLHFNLFSERFPPLNLLRNELHFWTLGVGAMTHGAKLTLLGAMIHGAELLFIASNVVVMWRIQVQYLGAVFRSMDLRV